MITCDLDLQQAQVLIENIIGQNFGDVVYSSEDKVIPNPNIWDKIWKSNCYNSPFTIISPNCLRIQTELK